MFPRLFRKGGRKGEEIERTHQHSPELGQLPRRWTTAAATTLAPQPMSVDVEGELLRSLSPSYPSSVSLSSPKAQEWTAEPGSEVEGRDHFSVEDDGEQPFLHDDQDAAPPPSELIHEEPAFTWDAVPNVALDSHLLSSIDQMVLLEREYKLKMEERAREELKILEAQMELERVEAGERESKIRFAKQKEKALAQQGPTLLEVLEARKQATRSRARVYVPGRGLHFATEKEEVDKQGRVIGDKSRPVRDYRVFPKPTLEGGGQEAEPNEADFDSQDSDSSVEDDTQELDFTGDDAGYAVNWISDPLEPAPLLQLDISHSQDEAGSDWIRLAESYVTESTRNSPQIQRSESFVSEKQVDQEIQDDKDSVTSSSSESGLSAVEFISQQDQTNTQAGPCKPSGSTKLTSRSEAAQDIIDAFDRMGDSTSLGDVHQPQRPYALKETSFSWEKREKSIPILVDQEEVESMAATIRQAPRVMMTTHSNTDDAVHRSSYRHLSGSPVGQPIRSSRVPSRHLISGLGHPTMYSPAPASPHTSTHRMSLPLALYPPFPGSCGSPTSLQTSNPYLVLPTHLSPTPLPHQGVPMMMMMKKMKMPPLHSNPYHTSPSALPVIQNTKLVSKVDQWRRNVHQVHRTRASTSSSSYTAQ